MSRKWSNSGDFRPPELRNDNRSPETHGQNKSLQDVYFPFLLLESIQSFHWTVHSDDDSVPERTYPQKFRCWWITRRRRELCTYSQWELLGLFRLQLQAVIVHLLFLDAHIDSRTDSQALRAEYCIVGIPHNTAIQFAFENCPVKDGRTMAVNITYIKYITGQPLTLELCK